MPLCWLRKLLEIPTGVAVETEEEEIALDNFLWCLEASYGKWLNLRYLIIICQARTRWRRNGEKFNEELCNIFKERNRRGSSE